MEDQTIIIDKLPYPVRFGHRCISIYAQRIGGTDISQISAAQIYEYYYAAIVAGCRRKRIPEPDFDSFFNELDDNPELFDQITNIRLEQEGTKKETSL
jgi:hypothetical protein